MHLNNEAIRAEKQGLGRTPGSCVYAAVPRRRINAVARRRCYLFDCPETFCWIDKRDSTLQSKVTTREFMATSIATAGLPVIKAAGGIVLRHTPRCDEVVVVYRKRHRDWTLPKGKLKDGESFEEAALREVQEETGCSCRLGSYLGGISYAISGIPKVVMFWKMSVVDEKPIAENDEIAEAVWMPVPTAIQKLTHAQEKSLLTRVAGGPKAVAAAAAAMAEIGSAPKPAEPAPIAASTVPIPSAPAPIVQPPAANEPAPPLVSTPAVTTPVSESPTQGPPRSVQPAPAPAAIANPPVTPAVAPEALQLSVPDLSGDRPQTRRQLSSEDRRTYSRVVHELEAFKVELAFLESRGPHDDTSWQAAAKEHISRVERCLDGYDVEGALASLRSARRYAVLGLNPAELAARAQILREESRKFSSWRAVAIQRLLAVADDKLTPARVSDAMGLRDEAATDQHLRSMIVNDRLRLVGGACGAGALLFVLSIPVSGMIHDYAPLAFFGLAGSSLAAVQMLIAAKSDGKLPNRFVLLALVLAGAMAGLAANFIYQFAVEYFKLEQQYLAAVFALALALGYIGERIAAHFAGYSRERTSSGPY
jgi:8-oxo-dGTP diphosphatase